MNLLKNTAYPLPTLGAIRMGSIEIVDGDRLPRKDDAFTITASTKDREGQWIKHPLHAKCQQAQSQRPSTLPTATAAAAAPAGDAAANEKLRAIPVRVLLNDTDLVVRESFEAFDSRTGRPLCRGDGETARRAGRSGVTKERCPTPTHCEFGREHRCKHFARVSLQIEGQDDPLGTSLLRSTGFNSARTLRAKLEMISALTGGRLRGIPLWLVLRAKSSRMSMNTPFYFADLEVGCPLDQVKVRADAQEDADRQAGLDIKALTEVVQKLLANGAFEDTEDDVGEFDDLLVDPATGAQERVQAADATTDAALATAASGATPAVSLAPVARIAAAAAQRPGRPQAQPAVGSAQRARATLAQLGIGPAAAGPSEASEALPAVG